MNINCINDKIANSKTALKPIILQAILDLFKEGKQVMTLKMVRQKCILLDSEFPKNSHNAAIGTSMRNAIKCGGRIVGEDRDFLDFTIAFDGNGNNLEIKTPKKTKPKVESKKKDKQNSSSKLHYDNKIEIEKLNLSKNFKVVMICAGGKNDSFFTAYPNENFVNNRLNNFEHHPDEIMNNGLTSWRDYLIENQSDTNIKKAYELYKPKKTGIYTRMYKKYLNRFFILSAGWGLVKSDFKLPNYDITFSNSSKNKNSIRKKKSVYKDFNQFYDVDMVPLISPDEDIIFVGSNAYLELFYQLTKNLPNKKIIYYNSKNNPKPLFGNYLYRRYFIKYPTNWHYELAEKIANGIIP